MASGLPNAMPGDDADWSLTPPVEAASLSSSEGGEGGPPADAGDGPRPSSLAADARQGIEGMLVLLAEARQEYDRAVLDGAISLTLHVGG